MKSHKLQQAASEVKFLWCLEPIFGFHFFGILNLLALLLVNTFVFDVNQLVWIVLLNCMVFLPVIVAYFTSLFTDTSKRTSRKRFFYACAVNNIGLIGILIGFVVVLFTAGWAYNVYQQPEWAKIVTVYKADLNEVDTALNSMIEDSPMPLVADGMEMGDAADSKMVAPAVEDKMAYIQPPYEIYVSDWIKAVVVFMIIAIVLFVQFHTTDVMFKWFTTTPI